MTIVKVAISRIYCHAVFHLGRTSPLSGLVVNGLETHPKKYLWSFPRWGLESWMTVVSKWYSHTPRDVQDRPLWYGKKILELLLTVLT